MTVTQKLEYSVLRTLFGNGNPWMPHDASTVSSLANLSWICTRRTGLWPHSPACPQRSGERAGNGRPEATWTLLQNPFSLSLLSPSHCSPSSPRPLPVHRYAIRWTNLACYNSSHSFVFEHTTHLNRHDEGHHCSHWPLCRRRHCQGCGH